MFANRVSQICHGKWWEDSNNDKRNQAVGMLPNGMTPGQLLLPSMCIKTPNQDWVQTLAQVLKTELSLVSHGNQLHKMIAAFTLSVLSNHMVTPWNLQLDVVTKDEDLMNNNYWMKLNRELMRLC